MLQLIKEYKLISDTLFSMNTQTNDQRDIAIEYSGRLVEIRSILAMDHFQIISF